MNRRRFLTGGAGAAAALRAGLPSSAGAAPDSNLKAGFAERDITPDIGMEQPGGYVKSRHTRFHDACKVRAAVFESGGSKAAVVAVDALMIPRSLVLAAREAIRKQCGLGPESVLISATHSHSSGPTGMVQPGEYDHADAFVRKIAYEETSCANAVYLDRVQAEIVAAVCHAHSLRAPARLGFGSGSEDKAGFNRRFRMKNGLTYTHPGTGNPDTVEPAGPIDPQVGVIGAWDEQGRLAGCIVNYTCHATTGPEGISANWIYYLEKTLRGTFGPDAVIVFLQGFAGDVTQVDNLSPHRQPSPDEYARLVGGRVGAETVKVLVSMTPGTEAVLNGASRVLKLDRRRPRRERVQQCLELARKSPKEIGHTRWVFAKEIVLLDALLAKYPTVDAEVQALQIGPAVLLAAPGEMFCDFGLRMKKPSRFPLTFAVELANGCVGYVQTEDAMGAHGGGYETRLTSYTNVELTAGQRMVDAALELVSRMEPGRIPEPARAAPFKGPWEYGNVPPEVE